MMRECLEKYAYPSELEGDRAYIFGHEAREVLNKLQESER
jgi:hypothetical protein